MANPIDPQEVGWRVANLPFKTETQSIVENIYAALEELLADSECDCKYKSYCPHSRAKAALARARGEQ